MASLYASSNTARKVLIGFVLFAIVILFFDNFGSITNITQTSDEAKRFYMKPNRIFGDLPKYVIPTISIDTSITPQYTIQSAFSSAFPDVSYVYRVMQPRENFQFLSTFEASASVLGFTEEPTVSGSDYSWQDTDKTKTLKYNSVSQIWSLETDLTANSDAKASRILSDSTSSYQSRIKSLVGNLEFDSKGFSEGVYDVKYLNLDSNSDFIVTDNALEAEFASGTGFRFLDQADLKPTNERPKLATGQVVPQEFDGKVYTSDPRKGSFSILFSNSLSSAAKDVFRMNFTNFEYTQQGIYQIITPDEGFSSLQNGQGALVSLTKPNVDYFENVPNAQVRRFSFDARRTELAFYEPQEWVGYTYPIYVYYATAELNDGSLANAVFFIDATKRTN